MFIDYDCDNVGHHGKHGWTGGQVQFDSNGTIKEMRTRNWENGSRSNGKAAATTIKTEKTWKSYVSKFIITIFELSKKKQHCYLVATSIDFWRKVWRGIWFEISNVLTGYRVIIDKYNFLKNNIAIDIIITDTKLGQVAKTRFRSIPNRHNHSDYHQFWLLPGSLDSCAGTCINI